MGEERKRERKTKLLPLSPRGLAALSVREGESYTISDAQKGGEIAGFQYMH